MKRVYFLRPVGQIGPIKIGCSVIPMDRLRAVEIWSPVVLEMIGHVPGDHTAECMIHFMFGDVRLHGEWFTATPELVAFIEETLALGAVPERVKMPRDPKQWQEAWANAKGRRHKRDLGGASRYTGSAAARAAAAESAASQSTDAPATMPILSVSV